MESIAVTKPDMTLVRQELLSPFGLLTQLFTRELVRRSEQSIGAYRPMQLAYLEENPDEAQPAIPEIHFDLDVDLIVNRLMKERRTAERSEKPATPAERILERIIVREKEIVRTAGPETRRIVIENGGRRVTAEVPVGGTAQAEAAAREKRERETRQTGEGRSTPQTEVLRRSAGLALSPLRGSPASQKPARLLPGNRTLTLASQAMSVPAAGGWTPKQREVHPGYPSQETKKDEAAVSAGSILLPDVMRRRREAAIERSETQGARSPASEFDEMLTGEALSWALEGTEQTPETERALREVRRAVRETLLRNALRGGTAEPPARGEAPRQADGSLREKTPAETQRRREAQDAPAGGGTTAAARAEEARQAAPAGEQRTVETIRETQPEAAQPEMRVPDEPTETLTQAAAMPEQSAQMPVTAELVFREEAGAAQTPATGTDEPDAAETLVAVPAAGEGPTDAPAGLIFREGMETEAAEPEAPNRGAATAPQEKEPQSKPGAAALTRAAADVKQDMTTAQALSAAPGAAEPPETAEQIREGTAVSPEAAAEKRRSEAAAMREREPAAAIQPEAPAARPESADAPAEALPAAQETPTAPPAELIFREGMAAEAAAPEAPNRGAVPAPQENEPQTRPGTAAQAPAAADVKQDMTTARAQTPSEAPRAAEPPETAVNVREAADVPSEAAAERQESEAAAMREREPAAAIQPEASAARPESADAPAEALPAAQETPTAPPAELIFRETAEAEAEERPGKAGERRAAQLPEQAAATTRGTAQAYAELMTGSGAAEQTAAAAALGKTPGEVSPEPEPRAGAADAAARADAQPAEGSVPRTGPATAAKREENERRTAEHSEAVPIRSEAPEAYSTELVYRAETAPEARGGEDRPAPEQPETDRTPAAATAAAPAAQPEARGKIAVTESAGAADVLPEALPGQETIQEAAPAELLYREEALPPKTEAAEAAKAPARERKSPAAEEIILRERERDDAAILDALPARPEAQTAEPGVLIYREEAGETAPEGAPRPAGEERQTAREPAHIPAETREIRRQAAQSLPEDAARPLKGAARGETDYETESSAVPGAPEVRTARTGTAAPQEEATGAHGLSEALPTQEEAQTAGAPELVFREEAGEQTADRTERIVGAPPPRTAHREPETARRGSVHPAGSAEGTQPHTVSQTLRDIRMVAARDRARPRTSERAEAAPAMAVPVPEAVQTPEQTELFFAAREPEPGLAEAESPDRPTERPAREDGTERLPAWAQELLEKSGAAVTTQQVAAFSAPAQTAADANRISWSAPGIPNPVNAARESVPPELAFRERNETEETAYRPPISDAEIRRTADRVYRMIEERLRRELRRSGR